MPRTAKHSKAQLIEKIADVFRSHGYDGASAAHLSDVTSLSKASLYHHFPGGKVDMAKAVLAREGVRLQKLVLAPLERTEDDHAALLGSLDGVAELYSGAVPACLMNSLLLGSGSAMFRDNINAAVTMWRKRFGESYGRLAGSLNEGEAWGNYAVERIQGALILCRATAARTPFDICLNELTGDVEALVE